MSREQRQYQDNEIISPEHVTNAAESGNFGCYQNPVENLRIPLGGPFSRCAR